MHSLEGERNPAHRHLKASRRDDIQQLVQLELRLDPQLSLRRRKVDLRLDNLRLLLQHLLQTLGAGRAMHALDREQPWP